MSGVGVSTRGGLANDLPRRLGSEGRGREQACPG